MFAWYRAAVTEAESAVKTAAAKDETARVEAVRGQLGAFLAEVSALLGRTENEKEPNPIGDAEAWAKRVEDYLTYNMGSAYVVRFRDASGLPPGFTSLNSEERVKLQGGLRVRPSRLQQFLSEMPATIVR
jgi:hypothetical protein